MGRPSGAESRDLGIAVEVLATAIADRPRIIVEKTVEHIDVVGNERRLVALEGGEHLCDNVRKVNVHRGSLCDQAQIAGRDALATPACSTAKAARSARSSRQGGAMICTAMGRGESGTGTATTGRPMNEIGCV